MTTCLDELHQSQNKNSNYMKEVAIKSTPENNYRTIDILSLAQKLVSGIENYTELFGYDIIGDSGMLIDNINNPENKKSNAIYSESGMTGILNVGMKNEEDKTKQEDSILILSHPKNPKFRLGMVADGVGGTEKGDLASNLATKLSMEWFKTLPETLYNYDTIYSEDDETRISFRDVISQHLININNEIVEKIGETAGTTFSAVITRNKNGKDTIMSISIGDSKVLRVGENGEVEQLSKDDNILSGGIEERSLYVDESDPSSIYTENPFYSIYATYKPIEEAEKPTVLTRDDIRFYSKRNVITQVLGVGQSNSEIQDAIYRNRKSIIRESYLGKGDKIILCSDGIADTLSNSELGSLIYTFRNSGECLRNIINVIYNREKEKNIKGSNNPPGYLVGNSNFYPTLKGASDNMSAVIIEEIGKVGGRE